MLVGDAPITFEQFPGGRANLTYLARAGDVELVLRRPPLGEVAPGSHDMAREYRVLAVLHERFPEAPRAHHYCPDPDVMGKPFFVMERRRGVVVREAWPDELEDSEDLRRTVAANLVDGLARLHSVSVADIGLADLGRPEGFVDRQVAGWTKRWSLAKDEEVGAMDRLAARLASTVPTPRGVALLHNDFKLDNCMIGTDGRLVAVFDWDMATVGDPLVDLGTLLTYWQGPPGMDEVWSHLVVSLGSAMPTTEVVERYGALTGIDTSGVEWYHALGLFRLAVILQQIYIRYRRGQTSDERFGGLGALVPPLAEYALEFV